MTRKIIVISDKEYCKNNKRNLCYWKDWCSKNKKCMIDKLKNQSRYVKAEK